MATYDKHAAKVADWIRTRSNCGNCAKPFTAARKAKSVAGIPNGAGTSMYVLCPACTRHFKKYGMDGIPNAVKDAKIASFLRFAPVGGAA